MDELYEEPEYVGGQPFPPDLWGRAPIRGQFVVALQAFFDHKVISGDTWGAGEIVDDLIAKGLIPDERAS